MDKKKLIIVGDGDFGQIAFDYFTYDSSYEVVGFAVESKFRTRDSLFNIPVVDLEKIESFFSKEDHYVFIAITYVQLNRPRTRVYLDVKNRGYKIASYVSSKAFCWRNVKVGENVFIFEDCTLQPFVEIGNNVIVWSGTNIGHHSVVRDNCFFSSHVAIPGHCYIGENSFIGVNASIANNITIAADSFICMGSVVTKSTDENNVYKGHPAFAIGKKSREMLKVYD